MKQYEQERTELEIKYLSLYQPLYEKRSGIISGEIPVEDRDQGEKSDTEVTEVTEVTESSEATTKSKVENEASEDNGIPDFWLTALQNHDYFQLLITERDAEVLKHLKDIRYEFLDGKDGFRLIFEFRENEFFHQTVLYKTYKLDDMFLMDEPTLKDVEG